MKTLTIANHKGGVGKTATCHNVSVILAKQYNLKVLMVDLDPQASLTQSCGITETEHSLADVLGNSNPGTLPLEAIVHELSENLYLVPSDIDLTLTELGMTNRIGRENVLRRAIATVNDRYDLCIIDCPPSLGLLSVGGLVAADAILTPTQPQAVDLRGLSLFLDTLERIKSELGLNLTFLGVLMTFYDDRLVHHKLAVEALRKAGLKLLPVNIGRSIRVAEASAAGESITDWEPSNPQAEKYRQVADIVYHWLQGDPI
jgi:chromosome partitioning protein